MRVKTFAGSSIRNIIKRTPTPSFVRGANASKTDRPSPSAHHPFDRQLRTFWPLCFDCLCCMHKIFMRWKICSNKSGTPLQQLQRQCRRLHVRATFHTQMKLREKRKTLLLKCSALAALPPPISSSLASLLLSALYQPFFHGSVNAQLLTAGAGARERERQ